MNKVDYISWLFLGVFHGDIGEHVRGRLHTDGDECRQVRGRMLSSVVS